MTVDLDPAPAEGVEVVHLFDDPVSLAVHRDHPLAGRAGLTLAELADETWIDVPRATSGGKVLMRACERAGFSPRVAFESDDYTVIQELVGAGVGLALIPALALCPSHESVLLRPVGPDRLWREVQAATRPDAFRSPAARAMLEILREQRPRPRRTAGQVATGVPPSR